jgi:hypothetical protein
MKYLSPNSKLWNFKAGHSLKNKSVISYHASKNQSNTEIKNSDALPYGYATLKINQQKSVDKYTTCLETLDEFHNDEKKQKCKPIDANTILLDQNVVKTFSKIIQIPEIRIEYILTDFEEFVANHNEINCSK